MIFAPHVVANSQCWSSHEGGGLCSRLQAQGAAVLFSIHCIVCFKQVAVPTHMIQCLKAWVLFIIFVCGNIGLHEYKHTIDLMAGFAAAA